MDSNGDSGPPCGVPSVTAILVPSGITGSPQNRRFCGAPAHARFQHVAHHGQEPPIGDALGDPVEQALMMNPVEKFRQIKVHHHLISSREVLLCLGDRGVGAAMRAEAMTAGVEGRFEDRLQNFQILSTPQSR